MPTPNLWRFTPRFHGLSACYGHVAHALRTLAPVAINSVLLLHYAAPRLACVKPAASVHPEPGSNSSLYIQYFSKLVLTLLDYQFQKKSTLLDFLVFGTFLLVQNSVLSMIFLTPFLSNRIAKVKPFFYSAKLF